MHVVHIFCATFLSRARKVISAVVEFIVLTELEYVSWYYRVVKGIVT